MLKTFRCCNVTERGRVLVREGEIPRESKAKAAKEVNECSQCAIDAMTPGEEKKTLME